MKKFILFLVEGKNDEREIGAILHSPCFDSYKEKYQIEFLTKGGDITASTGVTVKNIQQKLNDILLYFRKNGVPFKNIRTDEIHEFVQIVDADGAFIPNNNIVKGNNSGFFYTDTSIITSNVDGAVGRNRKKAEILQKLSEIQQIGNVPYSVYYASCNMDHLLFNNRTPSQSEKTAKAYNFIERCSANPSILNDSIFKQGIMEEGTYSESWTFIQQDCNSLQRHTNINLFFSDNAKNIK